MTVAISDLKNWINKGKEEKATHMLIVCNTSDWTDYPVYVQPSQNILDVVNVYKSTNIQKIMEIYNLSKDIEDQLNQYKAMEF